MSVEVDVVRFVHETGSAILIKVEDDREVWVPLSQVSEIHRTKGGGGTIVVSDWFARKEDLL